MDSRWGKKKDTKNNPSQSKELQKMGRSVPAKRAGRKGLPGLFDTNTISDSDLKSFIVNTKKCLVT